MQCQYRAKSVVPRRNLIKGLRKTGVSGVEVVDVTIWEGRRDRRKARKVWDQNRRMRISGPTRNFVARMKISHCARK